MLHSPQNPLKPQEGSEISPANMAEADDVRFISSAVKLPPFVPPPCRHSLFSSASSNFAKLPFNFNFNFKFNFNLESQSHPINLISQFFKNQPFSHRNVKTNRIFNSTFKNPPLFCSAALALSDSDSSPASASAPAQSKGGDEAGSMIPYRGDELGSVTPSKNVSSTRATEEERVLISEVLVRNKDGEELERKDLEAEALNALKASRANSALTVREVQEDVHRIIASGYFMSCMPVAVDTRDGIRLIFQVIGYFGWNVGRSSVLIINICLFIYILVGNDFFSTSSYCFQHIFS